VRGARREKEKDDQFSCRIITRWLSWGGNNLKEEI